MEPKRPMSSADVADAQRRGRRVLFSVPMIALTPKVYEAPETGFLLDEVCLDVDGRPSECDWYYWESKPVYAACIYSDAFRDYLMERCRAGVDKGLDVVNLDEIMTGIGLMDLDPGGTGFCRRCLDRFRAFEAATDGTDVAELEDDALRKELRTDEELYGRYRRFHEQSAFDVMIAFIDELRAYADRVGLKGKEPKKAASHNTAVTVAAETGIPGLVFLGWLVFAALLVTLRRSGSSFKGRACLAIAAAVAAIGVHSLFYNALFEDPMFWGLLALTALCARLPLRREAAEAPTVQEPSEPKEKVTA